MESLTIEDVMRCRQMPLLLTDKEAEAFLENEDLSEYDWSGLRKVHFRFPSQMEEARLELPEPPVDTLKNKADAEGAPYTQYISSLLQQDIS